MSGEKTEEPTHKKLEDARKKGQVAVSKDVMILIQLTLAFSLFFSVINTVAQWLLEYSGSLFQQSISYSNNQILAYVINARDVFIKIVFLFLSVTIVGGLVGVFAQIGFLFAPEAIKPSFKKFNFVENIKNMFSMKSITQLIISLFKVIFFLIIFYYIFTRQLDVVVLSYRDGFSGVLQVLLKLLKVLIYSALVLFIFLSAIDWATVFFFHRKSLRMSKQEVFDEYKQQEGDPHMKGHRQQTHRSLINSSLSSVSGAKAVVANPNHIAVALDYQPGVHDLPFILAIETDEFAYLMRKRAHELGIPIIRNVPLARGLYLDAEVNQYIPSAYLKMAAEVFREILAISKAANAPEQNENSNLDGKNELGTAYARSPEQGTSSPEGLSNLSNLDDTQ
jgi:type III secretion YscU/HrpY family protein